MFSSFRSRPGRSLHSTGIVSVSTGLVAAIAEDPSVDHLTLFSQVGADPPEGSRWSNVSITPSWRFDDPISLIRTFRALLERASRVDGYLFNTAITDFGRSAPANVVGLLAISFLARLSRKPVVTYMHYFLETADPANLGYRVSRLQRWGVHALERLLLTTTVVVFPLESQSATVERTFGRAPRHILIPFAEVFGWIAARNGPIREARFSSDEPMPILLLGVWGPQKDLTGVVRALQLAKERGGRFTLTITGAVNPHFPEARQELDRARSTADTSWIRFTDAVPEAELLDVIQSHDLLILPYNAAGGYSSSMSVGAYCGVAMISYDLPQLREGAKQLHVQPSFVLKGDTEVLVREILACDTAVQELRAHRRAIPRVEYDAQLRGAVHELVSLLRLK